MVEREYRLAVRGAQAKFTRMMAILAAGIFTFYAVFNPLFIADHAVLKVAAAQFAMVPLMIAYSWYVGRPGYPANGWIDAALFVGIQPLTYIWADTFAATGAAGWPFFSEFCFDLQMELAFACLAMAASVRQYALLSVAAVAWYLAVLIVRGYPPSVAFYSLAFFSSFAMVLFYINWAIDDKTRQLFAERQKSEALLNNVLPEVVARRLRGGQSTIADEHKDVTVVFADVCGFTAISAGNDPKRVIALLNAFFAAADEAVDRHGLDKVKTIGDAYMAVSGALSRPAETVGAAVDYAVEVHREARAIGEAFGLDFRLHIGIATGSVIGGVISAKRMSYDYWGETINLAARLQDVAEPAGIAVCAATRAALGPAVAFRAPRRVPVKGIGEIEAHDIDMAALARG